MSIEESINPSDLEIVLSSVINESKNNDLIIDSKKVDIESINIAGIDPNDYPDFVDAYAESASFEDGTELNDDQMDELNRHDEFLHELIIDY